MKKILLLFIFILVPSLAFANSNCIQYSKVSAFVLSDGKKIIINGKNCRVKKKMNSGWDETHNINFGHQNRAFTPKDPELKKAMKKKVAGHYLISRSCFEYYIPTITDYIASRL